MEFILYICCIIHNVELYWLLCSKVIKNIVLYHKFICSGCYIDNKEKSGYQRCSYLNDNKEIGNSTHST